MPVGLIQSAEAIERHVSSGEPNLQLGLRETFAAPWYVTYTSPRHEKHVAQQCEQRGISAFLPLYRSVRRWKDRKKQIELPLFPGYVFVQFTADRRLDLLRVPGVLQLISFQGKPAAVSISEIEALQTGLAGSALRPHPYLRAGRKVRIRSGPMAGISGILVRKKESARVVLSISLIERSVAMEVDEADVEVVR